MLMINPHLPWEGCYRLFEAHLIGPDLNVYGAALVGTPVLSFGFNQYLGWTHTLNTIDGTDLYELILDGTGYRFGGQVYSFETRRHEILILNADGTYQRERLSVQNSVHGPVIARAGGKALSLRIAGLETASLPAQYIAMARAKGREAFLTAVEKLQVPLFTILYADREGAIFSLFGGRVPRRAKGDWDFWSKIIPGHEPDTLWTETLKLSELPKVENPPSAWLQNSNDPPWTTTLPRRLDPKAYPPSLAPRLTISDRTLASLRFLESKPSFSLDDLIAGKFSTQLPVANDLVDDLIKLAKAADDPMLAAAAGVLAQWDRRVEAASRGAVLFMAWRRSMSDEQIMQLSTLEQNPTSPRQLTDTAQALDALIQAARHVQSLHGRLDVAWGDVYRLDVDGQDQGASGSDDTLGALRRLDFSVTATNRMRATGGDSFIAAIEFGETPRAQALLVYANSSQPGDASFKARQADLYKQGKLRTVRWTRQDIEQSTQFVETVRDMPR